MTADNWRHSICEECWNKKHPDNMVDVEIVSLAPTRQCCYCMNFHNSGIYTRDDPTQLECKGIHI